MDVIEGMQVASSVPSQEQNKAQQSLWCEMGWASGAPLRPEDARWLWREARTAARRPEPAGPRGRMLSSHHPDEGHHEQRNAGNAPQNRYPTNGSIYPVELLHVILHYYLTPAAPILLAGIFGWQTAGTPSMRKNAIMGHQLVKPD